MLAVGAMSHPATATTMQQAVATDVTVVHLDGVGHHPAMEAPEALAGILETFIVSIGSAQSTSDST